MLGKFIVCISTWWTPGSILPPVSSSLSTWQTSGSSLCMEFIKPYFMVYFQYIHDAVSFAVIFIITIFIIYVIVVYHLFHHLCQPDKSLDPFNHLFHHLCQPDKPLCQFFCLSHLFFFSVWNLSEVFFLFVPLCDEEGATACSENDAVCRSIGSVVSARVKIEYTKSLTYLSVQCINLLLYIFWRKLINKTNIIIFFNIYMILYLLL